MKHIAFVLLLACNNFIRFAAEGIQIQQGKLYRVRYFASIHHQGNLKALRV